MTQLQEHRLKFRFGADHVGVANLDEALKLPDARPTLASTGASEELIGIEQTQPVGFIEGTTEAPR